MLGLEIGLIDDSDGWAEGPSVVGGPTGHPGRHADWSGFLPAFGFPRFGGYCGNVRATWGPWTTSTINVKKKKRQPFR